jgi:predicted nucleic acid-binding protein
MRFVLDNSVAMRWLFGDGTPAALDYAARVLDAMAQEQAEAIVPSLFGLEAANVMARAEATGTLTEARGTEFLGLIRQMAITADPSTFAHSLGDTLQLARRYRLSAYDAAYLELALREGVPLATLDDGLRTALDQTGGCLF